MIFAIGLFTIAGACVFALLLWLLGAAALMWLAPALGLAGAALVMYSYAAPRYRYAAEDAYGPFVGGLVLVLWAWVMAAGLFFYG